MPKPVTLSNGQTWNSKTAAKAHFKAMLGRYANGQAIRDEGDHSDLSALLGRFDELIIEAFPKIGSGIDYFERRLNKSDGWSSPGFWVIRTDGTATDFSYVKAVDGASTSPTQEFYNACHNAVSRDLLNMKQEQFDHFADAEGLLECDITGELVPYAEAQLSHATPTFGDIVNDFRATMGWNDNIPAGLLTASGDAQISTHFLDEKHTADFRSYHHSVAVLRIVGKQRAADAAPIKLAPVRRPLRFK